MLAVVIVGGLVLVTAALVAAWSHRVPVKSSAMVLRFPSTVGESQVRAMLAGIAGLPRRSEVVLDIQATSRGLRHVVRAQAGALDVVASQLRGVLPDARLEPLGDEDEREWSGGLRLAWSGSHPLLRTEDASAASASLLSSLAALGDDEALLLRWRLRPARGPHLSGPAAGRPRHSSWLERTARSLRPEQPPAGSQLSALRQKYGGAVLHASATVAVAAGHPDRGWHLASRLASALRARQGQRGRLLIRRRSAAQTGRLLDGRGVRAALYSPAELSALIGWPIDGPQLPGLSLGAAPLLMPSPQIPTKGRVLGQANWPGAVQRPIAQPRAGIVQHALICGPTGVGKSTLLASLIAQDIAAGTSVVAIDAKGDLASALCSFIPERRRHEVIVLDPGAPGPVPGLRLFSGDADVAERSADVVLGVFRSIYADAWGVRSDQWMKAGLVLLHQDRSLTLADFPFVFSDDGLRRRLVGRTRDPLAMATWAAYEAMTPAERVQQTQAPLNRIMDVIGRRTVRVVVGQTKPTLDLARALKGQVVIVRLSPGEIGSPAARLIGALVVHEIFNAVLARSAEPEARRKPASVFIDEPRLLGDAGTPIDALYELARGANVAMHLASQSLARLPKGIREAATSNAATLIAFRQNHDDATLLARELPGVSAEALQALGRFEAVARVGLGPGDVTRPVTMTTRAMPEAISDPIAVRATSAACYGTEPAEVDAALARRHGLDITGHGDPKDDATSAGQAPVGRRRRAS